ncbi:MAG: bifunctional DNA-formamidopyrimidine glycosylase/DNA-(apurinic or apyrimidinic site) lyase [Caldilineaceae bacterium]|nr:bifunctional DNA-formamidopyrimidine glycosylase/DNA-(apurinic or apyrimidinic site) lyase [Caldilineaceae bacterium]
MPELPEVETYVRELEPLLRGRRITRAAVTWPRTIAAPTATMFVDQIADQRFSDFSRRGKYMLLGLESGDTLIVHLRMTGKLLVMAGDAPVDKHTHVVLDLDNGQRVHYNDTRKFGRMWLVTNPETVLRKLGPEPLSEAFSPAHLGAALAGRSAAIKALLLNQEIIAGVGNIYADEALFAAGIAPLRAGGDLSEAEVTALHNAVRRVLAAGIAARGSSLGGSSLQNYLRPSGEQGGFQEQHQVFRRTGKPCRTCGQPIERIIVAQRSTHYCPHCQR